MKKTGNNLSEKDLPYSRHRTLHGATDPADGSDAAKLRKAFSGQVFIRDRGFARGQDTMKGIQEGPCMGIGQPDPLFAFFRVEEHVKSPAE